MDKTLFEELVGSLKEAQAISRRRAKDSALQRPVGRPRLTAEQKIKLFDPVQHGGEVMADAPVGRETL